MLISFRKESRSKIKKCLKIAIAFLIVFTVAVSLLPRFEIHAAHTFSSGAVVIDSQAVADYGTEYIIEHGVYSVTVTDGVDVTLIFDGVTIDRSSDGFGDAATGSVTAAELYEAGRRLHSLTGDAAWTDTPYAGGYYVPTCPFLVTGGASVTVRFDGTCNFRAGGNGLYLSSANGSLSKAITDGSRGGYAGIQVDSGASLTIIGASNLEAYGAFPLAGTYGKSGILYDSDPLKVNPKYNASAPWDRPSAVNDSSINGGGAGIGGGAAYNTQTIAVADHGYTAGTPGEITIESGNIYAVGGHLAAGIGGGVNGAATSSQITINGGTVTAIGGRFATGIGDGDSTVDYESECYWNNYYIVVNGGHVNAYGGTSSAAIGTTDEITSRTGYRSGLSITVSGGTVYGHSGEAADKNSATAAIGSGQGTDMHDGSISVYSRAKVVAASFSQFAISNHGTDAVSSPMVNIDPSGYMYLARFAATEQERVFSMYPIKRDAAGNPMLISAKAYQVLSGEIPADAVYFALDRERYQYYLVDENGNAVDENGNILPENAEKVYPETIPDISYYYDTSGLIGTLTVPGKYTAFAVTLADPSVYGGIYAIHIPDGSEALSDDIFAIIQKHEPGTTSGQIVNQGEYHVPSGENSSLQETPNVIEDESANPLLELGVFAVDPDTGVAETENRIKNFNPGTYGYTVYLPYGTETFHLYSAYSIVDTKSTVTLDKGSLSTQVTLTYTEDKQRMVNTHEVSMDGSDSIDIWLRKDDLDSEGNDIYVTYRITVKIKPRYTIEMGALDKLYDGIRVVPAAEKLIKPTGYEYIVSDSLDSMPTGGYTVTSSAGIPGTVIASYTKEYARNYGSVSLTITTEVRKNGNSYDIYTTIINNDSWWWREEATITTSLYLDASSAASRIDIKMDRTTIGNLEIRAENGIIRLLDSGHSYDILSVALSDPMTESNMTAEEIAQAREQAIEAAKAEAQQNINPDTGETQASVNKQYSKGIQTEIFTLDITDLADGNGTGTFTYELRKTNNGTTMGNVRVYTVYTVDTDVTDEMTAIDKNSIVYTYYRILAVDDAGTPTSWEMIESAPKDAGLYFVMASLDTNEYEGFGGMLFRIYRREIEIIAIENWLTYKMPSELTEYGEGLSGYDGVIENPGEITFSGVLPGETVTLAEGYRVYYEDRGTIGTYADDIGYHESKIIIEEVRLDSENPVNQNYILHRSATQEDGSAVFRIYGQISYRTTGAIFRKTLTADSYWRKFYPTTDSTFLKWMTDENGDYVTDTSGNMIPADGETRIDYHSPSHTEHRDYVYLRTVNEGENAARYAVDIEFGAMQFTYSRAVWDVNRYDYVEGETSVWSGNDGVNNRISVVNYSNKSIQFSVDAMIEFEYRPITEGSLNGISFYLTGTDGSSYTLNTPVTVPAATEATEALPGSASRDSMQLVLTGVPQMNSEEFVTVGLVSVKIAKLP